MRPKFEHKRLLYPPDHTDRAAPQRQEKMSNTRSDATSTNALVVPPQATHCLAILMVYRAVLAITAPS
jgi:hypothetical protein